MKNNQYHLIILGLLREGLEGFAGKKDGEKFGEFSFYCKLCGRIYEEFIF